MSLLWKTATEISNSPSGFPAKVVHMPVGDLSQYVERDRTDDEGGKRHVKNLVDSFKSHGYDPKQHNGMDQWGQYSYAQPIHLVHDDQSSYLMNGNHRVRAAEQAGITHLPVTVTDMRGGKP